MAETNVVQALIAPNKYVQGRGVLSSPGRYVGEPGPDALAIADERVWDAYGRAFGDAAGAEEQVVP